MSDREKVIKKLEECLSASCRGFRTCPYSDADWDAVRETLALLREQEPQEPFARYDALRREFDCGACGFLVGFENAFDEHRYRAKYCPECGRRVRWE